jgi:hypothetical protein
MSAEAFESNLVPKRPVDRHRSSVTTLEAMFLGSVSHAVLKRRNSGARRSPQQQAAATHPFACCATTVRPAAARPWRRYSFRARQVVALTVVEG